MPARKGAMSPIIRHIRSLPDGPYYTVREAAPQVGTTVVTLRHLMNTQSDKYGAHALVPFGRMRIPVFNDATVRRARENLDIVRAGRPDRLRGLRGRPRMWMAIEADERAKLSSRASYLKRRSGVLLELGQNEAAAAMIAERGQILETLSAQNEKRIREVLGLPT